MTLRVTLFGGADLGSLIGKEVVAADGAIHGSRSKEVGHDAGLAGRDACQRCRAPPSVSSRPLYWKSAWPSPQVPMAGDAKQHYHN